MFRSISLLATSFFDEACLVFFLTARRDFCYDIGRVHEGKVEVPSGAANIERSRTEPVSARKALAPVWDPSRAAACHVRSGVAMRERDAAFWPRQASASGPPSRPSRVKDPSGIAFSSAQVRWTRRSSRAPNTVTKGGSFYYRPFSSVLENLEVLFGKRVPASFRKNIMYDTVKKNSVVRLRNTANNFRVCIRFCIA